MFTKDLKPTDKTIADVRPSVFHGRWTSHFADTELFCPQAP